MSQGISEAELYAILRESPVLAESTKFIIETDGVTEAEIAKALHKKQPSIHLVLQRLRLLSLVAIKSEGRRKIYRVVPKRKSVVESIIAKLYYPTRGFVIGELLNVRTSFNVQTDEHLKVKGTTFIHNFDIVYTYDDSISVGGNARFLGIIVLDNLVDEDILALGGKLLDLQDGGHVENIWEGLQGVLMVVVEDGSTRDAFSKLEQFLKVINEKVNIKTAAVLIEKKSPGSGLQDSIDWAVSALKD